MIPSQLIIIGGGASIRTGIEKGLWERLQGKFTFGLNYSYRIFESTALLYVDQQFYTKEFEGLSKVPLIIGNKFRMNIHPNTIMLPTSASYDETLESGVYTSALCGLFALSIGVYLEPTDIFLLGYDFCDNGKDKDNRPITHFYQGDIEHRGIGKTSYYASTGRVERAFEPYKTRENSNIWNVGHLSKITQFSRLSYDQFFQKLNSLSYDQDKIRQDLKEKLTTIKGAQCGPK